RRRRGARRRSHGRRRGVLDGSARDHCGWRRGPRASGLPKPRCGARQYAVPDGVRCRTVGPAVWEAAVMSGTPLTRAQVASMIDHTLLKPEASSQDVRALVDEATELGVYAVCVSPSMLP